MLLHVPSQVCHCRIFVLVCTTIVLAGIQCKTNSALIVYSILKTSRKSFKIYFIINKFLVPKETDRKKVEFKQMMIIFHST